MNWSAWGVEVGEGEGREVQLLVNAEASGEEVRAPVMVNVLLDRSGSMKGAPLAAAVEAAQQFVELSRADDFLGLLLFLIPAFYHLKRKLVRYTLTDSKLEIDSGLISRTRRSVPIRRIQDVTVSSGIAQRVLGFGDLVIDNASEEGGKAVLRNINTPKFYADVLLKQMRRLDR